MLNQVKVNHLFNKGKTKDKSLQLPVEACAGRENRTRPAGGWSFKAFESTRPRWQALSIAGTSTFTSKRKESTIRGQGGLVRALATPFHYVLSMSIVW